MEGKSKLERYQELLKRVNMLEKKEEAKIKELDDADDEELEEKIIQWHRDFNAERDEIRRLTKEYSESSSSKK
ncbi:hypothetical protein PGTUg99_035669 [Puccinia graminis f. sp. tritici]|uniref:Uncharacterized protein n=3 Tax=Puccinia graminis f. sp. tritici TaxID=56615 RepID=H6QV42_PUCGT|nr:uncharacterized protein PGTG_22625 [Puccinia graminis f. sp. tritici CRL 75-36-700-3]EHS62703.1 hypothetical protein PGTG_22625 [Puccinia graminis f. sp. tritici CRL 75-36-700-3]KAA1076101.1 hypothetical protein PGTUg99_035669 [Puccinia graminis f. sp. tritici]